MQFGLKATLLAAFLLVSHAHAAEPSEAELQQRREDAAQRYEQGVEAYQEGRHKDAIDLFLEADALAPSSALSFNIARAYEKIKDSSNALRWYRDYLRREPGAEDKAAVSRLIDDYEKVLEAKGLQQLTVLSEPETATVRVDGRPVGVTPWTGDVPPGNHTISVSLRGYADAERQITLASDAAQDVPFRLQPATEATPVPAPAPAPPAAADASPSPAVPNDTSSDEPQGVGVVTYIVLGAGVATLGAAGVFEITRGSAEDDAKNAKTQIEKSDALDTMDSRQTTARVLLGVGGALTVAGGVLLALDLTRSPDSGSAMKHPPEPQPELAASGACTFSDCFVSLQGSF